MLKSLFSKKTLDLLEDEKELLAKDLAVIKSMLEYLDKSKNICIGILKFAVKEKDVKQILENLLETGRTKQKEEGRLELESIRILEEKLEQALDEEVQEEISIMLQLLQEQKQSWEEMHALNQELKEKGYKIKPGTVSKIREVIEKQTSLLKTHETVINKLLGKVTGAEGKIKEMLSKVYGRAVSKERVDKIEKSLILSETEQLVPCFILTTKISDLLETDVIKRKKLRDVFSTVGAVRIEKIVLFKLDESQDLSILAGCPPPQPQKTAGLIEQKLPGRIRVKIIAVYSL
ncbi:hypothetical protein GF343_02580 [Candidatus Woesearchaeota archaeon]|nr:hypothetical protein [Candidatus Woesearchaeota archaeon]